MIVNMQFPHQTAQHATLVKPTIDWDLVRPTFLDVDAHKNHHELNPTGIPNALQMMVHLKLFIPSSMLTTNSLSRIHFNDNLKFKKIPFGHATGKYALDEAHFPALVNDIIFGSPIGNPPPLHHTFIPDNLPSTTSLPDIIDHEIASELATNQMSGPFSICQAHTIFRGHFRTSPLSLVEKDPGSEKWRAICHLFKEDAHGDSTNGWLNPNEFPTKYYSTSMTADFVSYLFKN